MTAKSARQTFVLNRVDQEIPAEVRKCRNASVRLRRFKFVESLADFPNIKQLELFDCLLTSLDLLGRLTGLRRLEITHFPKVHSLRPLSSLTKLEDLELAILPSYVGKPQRVDSLRPLASLVKLKRLALRGVVADDGDLSSLYGLKNLRELFVPNLYSQEALATLAGHLPRVRREWFLRPFVKMDEVKCKRCGTAKVMLSGSDIRPGVICPACQKKKIQSARRQV